MTRQVSVEHIRRTFTSGVIKGCTVNVRQYVDTPRQVGTVVAVDPEDGRPSYRDEVTGWSSPGESA